MRQEAIPVADQPPPSGPCDWCGEPGVAAVQVEPPRYRNDRGVRVVAKPALVRRVCETHRKSFAALVVE